MLKQGQGLCQKSPHQEVKSCGSRTSCSFYAAAKEIRRILVRAVWRSRRCASDMTSFRYDLGRRKYRTSSCTRQKRFADSALLKPPIGSMRCLIPLWSCSAGHTQREKRFSPALVRDSEKDEKIALLIASEGLVRYRYRGAGAQKTGLRRRRIS